MKRLFSFVALLMVSVMVIPHADARKFGGGKSFGKSFRTAPSHKYNSNTSTLNKKGTANTQSGRRGLMGGLLGGLLAGGLFAALLGGGGFHGIQFMDILILGAIAFVIFRLMRGSLAAKQASMNQQRHAYDGHFRDQSYNHNQQFEQPQNTGGFGTSAQSEVPHNYPPGFDQVAFVNGAREHYRIIQGAWNYNQLDKIREYVSQSLFDDLKAERAKLSGEQHTDVMYVDAEIVRCDYDATTAQLSLQFSGRYRDAEEGIEENIEDIWHLERDLTVADAPWLIVGIQNA
ncbi:MAG: Tim44 domain-containing protein [Vibrio sp.]